MKVYLAGPMRGHDRFNFDEFARQATLLRSHGHAVVSPAEMDLAEGFDPDNPGEISRNRYEQWMRRDFRALAGCDAIFIMRGWQYSEGSKRELSAAISMGLEVRLCD